MTDTQERALKFAYFALGIALPVAGWVLWCKTEGFGLRRKKRMDEALDAAVEDTFPASDPLAAW
ncbi:MAG: hypothetical protein JOZ62_10830 [Acidobacteriaceae bacterium]|nr:hypothetical protein [Acidobacteriaceae bacterium]